MFRNLTLMLFLMVPTMAFAQAEGPQERALDQSLKSDSGGNTINSTTLAPPPLPPAPDPGYVQITPQTDAEIERKIAADAAARRMKQPTALAPVMQSDTATSPATPPAPVQAYAPPQHENPPASLPPTGGHWEGPQERALDRELGSDSVIVEPPSPNDPESAEIRHLNGGN